jgi:hypothetical protein
VQEKQIALNPNLHPALCVRVTCIIVWFDAPKTAVHWLLEVHSLSVVGLHSLYPVLVGCAALMLALSGLRMGRATDYLARAVRRTKTLLFGAAPQSSAEAPAAEIGLPPLWPQRWTLRSTHRLSVALAVIPFAITAMSGAAYTVVKQWGSWFGVSAASAQAMGKTLMGVHQGSWLMVVSPVVYVTALGSVLVVALVTGLYMSRWCKVTVDTFLSCDALLICTSTTLCWFVAQS